MTYNNPLNTRLTEDDPNAMIEPDAVRDNFIANLRETYKDRVVRYSNRRIAQRWREWAVSEDYPDEELFVVNWLPLNSQL